MSVSAEKDTVVRFRTSDYSVARRADAWASALEESHLAWNLTHRPVSDFSASVAMRQFNGYRLIRCACDATRGERSANEIASTNEQALSLLYLRDGQEVITIEGQELLLQRGDLVLWDSARRMTFNVPKRLDKLTLMFPERALTTLFPNASDYVGKVVSRGHGLSSILSDYLDSIEREMWEMSPDDLTAAMKPTMDLLATVLTMESRLEPRSIKCITLSRIKQHIVDNLDDETLNPQGIAAAIGITPRYLHLLFRDVGCTVSQWIKERRLERCKVDIMQSLVNGRSITEIAYSRGFNHLSHFSRAFKQQFGMAPREYARRLKAEHAVAANAD